MNALYYSNRIVLHYNKVSFQELLHCFDNDFENNLENNADNLEHNAVELQEILNRIMQRIMSIITSALMLLASKDSPLNSAFVIENLCN